MCVFNNYLSKTYELLILIKQMPGYFYFLLIVIYFDKTKKLKYAKKFSHTDNKLTEIDLLKCNPTEVHYVIDS